MTSEISFLHPNLCKCVRLSESPVAGQSGQHTHGGAPVPAEAAHRLPAEEVLEGLEPAHNRCMHQALCSPASTEKNISSIVPQDHPLSVPFLQYLPNSQESPPPYLSLEESQGEDHWNLTRSLRFNMPVPEKLPILNLSCTSDIVTAPTRLSLLPRLKPVAGSIRSSPFT